MQGVIDEYRSTYDKENERIFGSYVDVTDNVAVIEVDEATLQIKSNIDPDMPLEFKLGSPVCVYEEVAPAAAVTISPGNTLVNRHENYLWSSRIPFSAGIGATDKNGKELLVACGHSMKVGDKIFWNTTHIGNVSYASFYQNCEGDFCLIELIDGNTADCFGWASDGAFYSKGSRNPLKGETVFKYTQNSGFASFKVIETDKDVDTYYSDSEYYTVKHQMMATLVSGKVPVGDSGGGVFCSNANGYNYFCGIMSGYGNGYLSFTPQSTISKFCSIKSK